MAKKPVVLCILDGVGYSEKQEFNAVKKAHTPAIDAICAEYPSTLLHAAGEHVGLPANQMGNSEVGHTAIGLGRVIYQDLPKISMAIKNDTLKDVPELQNVIQTLKNNNRSCHLWGLLSDGGIHSHIDHLFALIDVLLAHDIKVCVHACLDGRDTPPKSALKYIASFEQRYANTKAQLSTVSGRYFAMDRDKRWERVEPAYHTIVSPTEFCANAHEYVFNCYENEVFDEFVPPRAVEGYKGVQAGDAFVIFNFRTDRVRQMIMALVDPDFSGFARNEQPEFSHVVGMVEYSSDYKDRVGVMFKKEQIVNSLGEVVAKAGLKQLRAAETEKYPHVTFFFNGGVEKSFENEDRILINSPKVATYDLQPEMSARELTGALIENLQDDNYDFYVVNFANPDMVGHTGNFDAVISALETVDCCVSDIWALVRQKGGTLLLTADHGNAEQMFDESSNQPHTAHTTNDVIFVLASDEYKNAKLDDNKGLKDIAPTVLDILHIEQPEEMIGTTLIIQ